MDIDSYIALFPQPVQERLQQMRQTILEAAPEVQETISYRMPTFKLRGKNLVHFAAYPNHIGFYPAPSGIEAFKPQLAGYKTSKGAVQFPLQQPIPLQLVRQIVEFRVQESG